MKEGITFLRYKQVSARTGRTRASLNYLIPIGLFVKPIRLSERTAGFPKHEVDAILEAQYKGASVDEIRSLVQALHNARKAA